MKYGINNLSNVPGRGEPADSAEMVTQLLFGDHYKVIDERAKWVKIRMSYDKYECWICRKQWVEINKEQYDLLDQQPIVACAELVGLTKSSLTKDYTPVTLGASLPGVEEGSFDFADDHIAFEGEVSDPETNDKRRLAVDFASMFLNAPYHWGGKSVFGIDCSGLSQIVYKLVGVKLPRDAYQQAEIGATLSFVEEAEAGDLAFFDNDEGRITHVGIILNDSYIIHASGSVRIDRIDHQGIYNAQLNKYTHKLRLIKSVL